MTPHPFFRLVRHVFVACAAATLTLGYGQSARLANISTRGQVGPDANNLFGGFVVAGAPKTVLVRAVGPGLAAFGVPGTLVAPKLTVFDSRNTVVATAESWNAADASTFASVGAFPLPANSKDAALVLTLQPGAYTAQISGVGAQNTGVALLEVYDVAGAGELVNIATRLNVGTGANAAVAGFVVSPGSGTRKLLIRGIGPALGGFGLAGFIPDPKLTLVDQSQNVLGAALANGGAEEVKAAAGGAGAFASSATDSTLIATVVPGSYTVQLAGNAGTTSGVGLIEVYDITNSTDTAAGFGMSPLLYYTTLRGATAGSTASGYATVIFDPNTNTGTVSVSYSGLSSATTSAHLVLGSNFVLNLPRGQVAGQPWLINNVGPNSAAEIVAALMTGNIAVQIDTAKFPGGELAGRFAATAGSRTFVAPAAPPALPANALTNPTQTDAARLLQQATFGVAMADLSTVMSRGIDGWITDQMALPATSALAALRADIAQFPNPPLPPQMGDERYAWLQNLYASWWKTTVTAPDQLRQRVAFALSEILVIGHQDDIDYYLEGKAKYYDLLVNQAFGNYRTLLEEVTLNPIMGFWLSHRGNAKANPAKGTAPDENYAREVQQLFSVGLVQLQADGTLMLDAAGEAIPTYDQSVISDTAKVLTGWTYTGFNPATTDQAVFTRMYPAVAPNYPASLGDSNPWMVPMVAYENFHDTTEKRIIGLQQTSPAARTVIPAGQKAAQDLKILLDTLFNHPNTAPFLSRQLIQRLVTSNPSPGYVYRVAQAFANDGTGVRGNLGAVVRAILTDYEARSPDVLSNFGYGKIKEPLIRISAFFRALDAKAPNGRFMDSYFLDPRKGSLPLFQPAGMISWPLGFTNQALMWAPTVFNFFTPTYAPQGAVAAAGLVAPEMEITDSMFAMLVPNVFSEFLYRDPATLPAPPTGPSPFIVLDYSAFTANARNPAALVDQLNLLFCANQMSTSARTIIVNALQSLPAATADLERIKTAIQLVVSSPDSALQK